MVQLNYKASNIAKAEKEMGESFFGALSTLNSTSSVSALLFLFVAGGGTQDELDELFKQGVDKAMVEVMSGIADAGFLGKTVTSKTIRTEVTKAMAEAFKESVESIAASENSGKIKNA